MIKRVKNVINEFREENRKLNLEIKDLRNQIKEIQWANIYHDSIRGKKEIQNLNLNIGRWAGNYTFFYILNRILSDCKPKSILELGLGESSKFISTYIKHYLKQTIHTIVEHDIEWITEFENKFTFNEQSKIILCPLQTVNINGHDSYTYQEFDRNLEDVYDLYLIDGPFGSERFSRYDIVSKVNKFNSDSDFIIVIDDSHRVGESDTIAVILDILKTKHSKVHVGVYEGDKSVTVLSSDKFKKCSSF
jgi:hypothetical protein